MGLACEYAADQAETFKSEKIARQEICSSGQ